MPATLTTSIQSPVIVRAGRTRPSLFDTVTLTTGANASGPALSLSENDEVKFSMRPIMSRAPIINEEPARVLTVEGGNAFNIGYDWQEENVEVEGEFMGWWTCPDDEGNPQDTPEFPIIITNHGPGEGVATGAIVSGVAAEMPTTFDALKEDVNFGDRFLQAKAELIKYKVLGATIPAEQEATLHPMLLDYFSKRVALEIIRPAIDYWSRQHRTVTTTGTSEVVSYPDMIASLKRLEEILIAACKELWPELKFVVPSLPKRNIIHLPTSDMTNIPMETKSPYLTQPLETGLFGWGTLGTFPFP